MEEITLINLIRFILIPIFFLILNYSYYNKLNSYLDNPKKILLFSSFLYLLILIILKSLKFTTGNYEFFDLGLKYSEFNHNSNNSFFENLVFYLTFSHFSPLKIIYLYFYKFSENFLFVILFQTIIIVFTGHILYKYLKLINKDNKIVSIAILVYYFNPITSFYDILGFHIEHLLFPFLILTFYYYKKEKFYISFLFLLLISFISESYILTSSFFGIYFFLDKKKKYGISIFLFFLIFFILIFFYYQPLVGSISSYKYVFSNNSAYFDYKIIDIPNLFKQLVDLHKIFLIFFLIFCFGFFININYKILPIAIPSLLKVLLSTELYHYSIDGHYLNDIFIILLISYVNEIKVFKNEIFIKFKKVISITALITFIISDSVFPISFNFYLNTHSGTYNMKNYILNLDQNDLKAINNLKKNKNIKFVEITNVKYPSSIYKNFQIKFFPSNDFKNSDAIILPLNANYLYGGSHLSTPDYNKKYIDVKNKISNFYYIYKYTDNFIIYLNKKISD